ncbi:MAG: DUF262 domain-containing protein [Parvibaculum sp.]
MATNLVNLDALIHRDNFQVKVQTGREYDRGEKLKITDLEPKSFMYGALRKPDFQRETANWTPQKIQDFIKTFLEGDLVPAIIMWGAGDTAFVVDGAHRLSALIAWVQDDYGAGSRSRDFFKNDIPKEQIRAHEKTRALIDGSVGPYAEYVAASEHPERSRSEIVNIAKRLGSRSLQLQWILNADADKAEASFFKINQAATPIDPTELRILNSRKSANSIAARVIVRNATGHEYWSGFTDDRNKSETENLGREIYKLLFHPPMETPIKTLDLPVAGRGYSGQTLPLIFDFVNLANAIPVVDSKKASKKVLDEKPKTDDDGSDTVEFLRSVRKLVYRITGLHASSLGLHPAVYFYSATGRHQPNAFLAIVEFIKEMERKNNFREFTDVRKNFENFFLANKSYANQVTVKIGSGAAKGGYIRLKNLYVRVFELCLLGKNDDQINEALKSDPEFSFLQPDTAMLEGKPTKFSKEIKSATFLKEAISGAPRCRICGCLLHFNSISIDHIVRRQDGGLGVRENAQLSHPYCNTTYKN